jgi:uncharacterized protein (TIRG00374 family)
VGQTLRWALGIVAAGVALNAVFGRRDELAGAVSTLENLQWAWVVLAVGAESASIVAYAALQRRLLSAGGLSVGMGPLTGITLAANAIQNSLPVGPAWSTIYAFRQFRRRGADSVLAGWTLAISTVVAFASLGAIALVGLALSQGQASSLDLAKGILVSAVIALALVVGARKGVLVGPLRTAAVGMVRASQRLFHRPHGEPAAIVQAGIDRVHAVRLSRNVLLWAFVWAVANWLLDLSCLAIAFSAVHSSVPWRGLLLAYGAGQLAANLPLTLGGLGVVEGSLTIALVFYGGAEAATVAAVLLYRIISFWLLLPVGWSSALFLKVRGPAEPAEVAAAAGAATREAGAAS